MREVPEEKVARLLTVPFALGIWLILFMVLMVFIVFMVCFPSRVHCMPFKSPSLTYAI